MEYIIQLGHSYYFSHHLGFENSLYFLILLKKAQDGDPRDHVLLVSSVLIEVNQWFVRSPKGSWMN